MFRKKENFKMKNQLVIFVVFIVFLSSSIITLFGNIIYKKSIMKYAYDNMGEMQKQVQISIDSTITFISHVLSTFSDNEDVMEYMKVDAQNDQESRLYYETSVRNIALKYSDNYKQIMNLVVVSDKGQYLSNDSYRIQDYPLTQTEWYTEAVKGEGKPVIITSDMGRNLKTAKDSGMDVYFSVVQAVYSETKELLGVVLVDWNMEEISNMAQNVTLSETGFIFIIDDKNNILYAPKNNVIYKIKPGWFNESNVTGCIIDGKKYNLIYNKSDITGLTTVGMYDTNKTVGAVKNVTKMSSMIAIITMIFGIIYTFIFSDSFTKPIKNMSDLMGKVQDGDFTVRFDDYCGSMEVKKLGDSFNTTIERVNYLMEVIYKEQKQKREAELRVLQEQIKPHFLYNTLDTIQWMAKEYNAYDIVDMVKALSSFFRVSLSKGKEYVSLDVELSMIKNYLDIQSYRYEDMFVYDIEYEEEIKKCRFLKLTLQPIVENALYHGIKEADTHEGVIEVKCTKENDETILVVVEDNGVGIDEEVCEQLNQLFETCNRPSDTKFYGTLNVNERIRITYGDGYGLKISKREGCGTRVEIRTGIREV